MDGLEDVVGGGHTLKDAERWDKVKRTLWAESIMEMVVLLTIRLDRCLAILHGANQVGHTRPL